MTTTLRAHFDGKVLVPEEPVDLPEGQTLKLDVVAAEQSGLTPRQHPAIPASHGDAPAQGLARLYEMIKDLPSDPDSPCDRAAQHDHYLYGTPKRP